MVAAFLKNHVTNQVVFSKAARLKTTMANMSDSPPSFPRKRESSLSIVITHLDSRFRENDNLMT